MGMKTETTAAALLSGSKSNLPSPKDSEEALEVLFHQVEMEVARITEISGFGTFKRLSERAIDLSALIASQHPDLVGKTSEIRSFLSWEASRHRMAHEVAGGPRRVRTAAALQEAFHTRLASEALSTIWQEDVLESREVALALGAKSTNREKVSVLRTRSQLLGLPRDRGYLYPAFQIDLDRREVYPEVGQVNETLQAVDDPWGVASWWVSVNDRIDARPMDLVGSDQTEALIQAAKAVIAPVG